jgi:hypothetical protein
MQASQASSYKARCVAVLLTAASPMIGSFGVSAQQMASGPSVSKCETAADVKQSPDCDLDASIANSKARIKAADSQLKAAGAQIAAATKSIAINDTATSAANIEITCNKELRSVAQDPVKQARGRELLLASGKDVGQYGACKLLQQLRNN